MPRLLSITAAHGAAPIAEATRRLRAGGLVALPTETVYGLGADTYNVAAIEAVYDLKGRPGDNPLIAHVRDRGGARRLASAWDERSDALIERFWPGPLTLVLSRADGVPAEATAGRDTIAIRCPDHPAALALLDAFGSPISAPSANRSGHVSPTTAAHVLQEFPEADDLLVLDGGPCGIGIESTVLDLSGDRSRILRPGSVTIDDLRAVIGAVEAPSIGSQAAGPGTSPAHYAPRTRTELVPEGRLTERLATLTAPVVVLCFDDAAVQPPHRAMAMPSRPEDYAHRLYGALREADALEMDLILIEGPGDDAGLWHAIRDRLRRAAGGVQGDSGSTV